MTPCEERNYRVGQVFVLTRQRSIYPAGTLVRLYVDDGTTIPLFKLETNKDVEFYIAIDSIKPRTKPSKYKAVDVEDGGYCLVKRRKNSNSSWTRWGCTGHSTYEAALEELKEDLLSRSLSIGRSEFKIVRVVYAEEGEDSEVFTL